MTELLSPKPISQSFSNKEINTAANEEGNNNNNMMVNPVTRSNGGAPNTKNVSRAAATPNSAQKKKNAAMSLTSLFAGGDSGNISGGSNTEEEEEVAAVDVAVPALDTITEMVTLSESNSASFETDNNSIGNNLGVDMDKAANDKRKVDEINNSTEEEEPFSDPMMNYVDPSALVEEQANNNASAGGVDNSPRKKSRHAYVAPPNPVQQHQQQPTPLANVVSTPQKVASILASQLPKTNVPPGVPMPQLPAVQYLPPSSGKTSFEQLMQATTMTSPVPGAAKGGQPIYARSLPTQWTATQQAASMPYLNGVPQQQPQQQQNGSEPPSRKDKSLGVLCKSFMDLYKDAPPNRNDNGAVVEIVEVADHLGVKRRRIYDIINILESIDIVARVKKNTYRWHGTGELPKFFAQLQRDAIDEQTRKMNGTWVENPNKPKVKGMASTCQKLLQIFLTTGKTDFTLAYAADVIMGPAAEAAEEAAKAAAAAASVHNPIPLPDPLAPPALPAVIGDQQMAVATVVPSGAVVKSSNATAQKAMKTKVRRMYDIANVLQALGIIEKYNVGSTSTENKPSLRWVFFLSPEEISQYAQSGGGEATI